MRARKSIRLVFSALDSHEEFTAQLMPQGRGWLVQSEHVPHGRSIVEPNNPVPYTTAKMIYDNLVASKIAKGYVPAVNPVDVTPIENSVLDIAPIAPTPAARPVWSIRGA